MKALKNRVATKEGRAQLALLYRRHLRKDRNLTSMCLYSGPLTQPRSVQCTVYGEVFDSRTASPSYLLWQGPDERVGWLGTGDAHLERTERRQGLQTFFSNLLPLVGTIVLPHHGSKRNITTRFIQDLPSRTWVAPYGTKNRYRHPDQHVIRVARSYGATTRVTERRSTEFTQTMALE